jgi:phospholipase/carboxylesterase
MKSIAQLLFVFLLSIVTSAEAQEPINGLALKYLVQLPTEKSATPPVVILLHGYGSNEKDLFELRSSFPKNYIIIAARAPYSVSGGGYQWFEREIVNGKYTGRKDHLDHSRNAILKFIPQVVAKYGANAAKVYVMGFSQGAMMSYEAGLTAPKAVRGIGVLSGTMPESLKPLIRKSNELSAMKIFIAHGTADSRLPYADGKAAYDYLVSLGLKPEFHKYEGMDHTISQDVLHDLLKWLQG